jgi:hypothetical protein
MKRPTRRSINPPRQMDSTENKLRTQCPGENARNSKTIAPTWLTRIEPMPHMTSNSLSPPATAPSPVAFCRKIAMRSPIPIGIHGTHTSATPQKKRLFFTSSTEFPEPLCPACGKKPYFLEASFT